MPSRSPSACATFRASSGRSARRFACSSRSGIFCAWNSPPSTFRASIDCTIFIRSGSFRPWGGRWWATPSPTATWWNRSADFRSRRRSPRCCTAPASAGCRIGACPAASWRSTPAGGCDPARPHMNLLLRGSAPESPGRRPPIVFAPAHLARLAHAGFVFAREGVFGLLDPVYFPWPIGLVLRLGRLLDRRTGATAAAGAAGAAGTAGAVRLAAALTRLGPSYVKLGQFLATRPDIVGAALSRDLENLQDRMA